FYYYFRSKEELGYAIIDRVMHGFIERTLEPAFADPSGDPIAQIHVFLDRVLDNQRQRNCVGGCPIGNLASELSDVHEGFRQRLAGIFGEWRAKLTEALSRSQVGDLVREDFEPSALAQFLVAALEGAILLTKVTKDIRIMERCVEQLKQHLAFYTMRIGSIQTPGAPGAPAPRRTR
ncbi:MAG TPA: TetR family transcriptional regulator C-terminal domain-containing protein, partial [Candidatus Methylomirabilis sp.]|nr:TetR family transcriptional regulator C-terminal domain-containing protein [Candidatus Methylomirabilis sp.]